MFCNKCGKELPDDAEFCVECGVKIVRREPGKAQIKAAKKVQIKAPAETSKEAPVESVGSVESELEKKNTDKKWWIFGGVAAVLAAVGVLLVVVLGGKGKLFGGQDGLTEEVATDPGEVQTDGSGETAGVGDAAGSGDARTDGSEEMTNLSLCFQEVIYKAGLADARVFLTVGYDNPDGEIVAEFTTQTDGTVQTELAAGEYTLCWEAGGYYSGHENLTVNGTETSVVKHMLPVLTEQKAYVLIEWDSDRDLDLCVFNAQTNQYINITSAVDDAGNFLYFDNSGADGYELIYLSDYTAGIYTVYVRDEASLLQGTGSSMEAEGLTVSIYTADGLLYYGKAEAAESAALWSPVYLYQGEAIGLSDSDCYIYDMTNYAWAVRDKGAVVEMPEDHVMDWKDPNLEAAMREITGITRGDIMLSDVWEIQELDLSRCGISDISALGELTNLQHLNLHGNNISDISGLRGLTNLQELDLSDSGETGGLVDHNYISDISVLSGLTNLQYLNLQSTHISDISALRALTNLQKLDLSYCFSISDISALSGLKKLQYLYLGGNNISDISALSGLTNLQILSLGEYNIFGESNNISDFSALRDLTNLERLNLGYTNISDLSVISGLTNLQSLDLSWNNISDISALSGLTNLQSLDLSWNNISDISVLSGLTNLQYLNLYENSISDYSPVDFVPNVTMF